MPAAAAARNTTRRRCSPRGSASCPAAPSSAPRRTSPVRFAQTRPTARVPPRKKHQPEQRRRLRTPGLVDAEGRRRRVCRGVCHVPHARSPTVERRAYGGPARGLSSWCCVAGHSDATCAGLTRLAAAERTTDRRAERHPPVRAQQKLALGGRPSSCRTTALHDHRHRRTYLLSHDSHTTLPARTVARDAARRTRRPGRAWPVSYTHLTL